LAALYVTDFLGNDRLFAFYKLKSINFSRHNSGGAQQSLNRNFIAPIPIGIPPVPDQKAIAEALSDADAVIDTLENLLAKTHDLKQGAMQELLTGKKRLPGFETKGIYKQTEVGVIPVDWEIRPVSTFGDVVTGGTPPTAEKGYWHGEFPWVTPTDISTRRDIYTSERCISPSGLHTLRKLPQTLSW
jgi:type I restriction enzyme S subunit